MLTPFHRQWPMEGMCPWVIDSHLALYTCCWSRSLRLFGTVAPHVMLCPEVRGYCNKRCHNSQGLAPTTQSLFSHRLLFSSLHRDNGSQNCLLFIAGYFFPQECPVHLVFHRVTFNPWDTYITSQDNVTWSRTVNWMLDSDWWRDGRRASQKHIVYCQMFMWLWICWGRKLCICQCHTLHQVPFPLIILTAPHHHHHTPSCQTQSASFFICLSQTSQTWPHFRGTHCAAQLSLFPNLSPALAKAFQIHTDTGECPWAHL